MPFPVKKIYKEGSPGARRKKSGITLTQIKRNIRSGSVSRKFYVQGGELAP